MRAWLMLLALAGCDRVFGLGDPYEDAAVFDAPRSDDDAVSHDDALADDGGIDGTGALEPIAYFPFDSDFNNSVDHTPGVCANGCSTTTGHTGAGALHLAGGCVQTMIDAMPPSFMLAFWAQPSTTSVATIVARKFTSTGTHFSWKVFEGGASGASLGFTMFDGGAADTNKLTGMTDFVVGEWHHFAVTFDGSLETLYVDGVMKASQQANATMYLGNLVYIGCDPDASSAYFGDLDELRIYDVAMSPAGIMALANQ